MTITLKDVQSKVITLEDVHRQFDLTEPLASNHIDSGSNIRFHLEADWASGIDAIDNTDPVAVTMTIDGTERQMTKEAVFQAAASHGLLAPYIKKIPAELSARLLNFHYRGGMGTNEFNVLSVADTVAAFTRPTIVPFSNRRLLDNVVAGVQKRLGSDVPIFADYKIHNSLLRTDVRLILPTVEREITDHGMHDVPANEGDMWFHGLHLSNSLVGKTQTTLEGYTFRYWCTNGCTTTMQDAGTWSRKVNGQQDDVYQWMEDQVEDVLGGLEFHMDHVQSLTNLDTANNTGDVLRQIFDEYNVPLRQRKAVDDMLLGVPETTMYTIMNAITMTANEADMPDGRRDALMRIGGAIPTDTFDTLKAQVWREGHSAGETAPNPYEIRLKG